MTPNNYFADKAIEEAAFVLERIDKKRPAGTDGDRLTRN
jgi:hypothetical protein